MNTALNTTRTNNYVEEKKAAQTKTDLEKSKIMQNMQERKDKITNDKSIADQEATSLAAYKTLYDTTGKNLQATKLANIKAEGA